MLQKSLNFSQCTPLLQAKMTDSITRFGQPYRLTTSNTMQSTRD